MKIRISTRLHLILFSVLGAMTLSLGWIATRTLERQVIQKLRRDSLQHARLSGDRIHDRFRLMVEKAHLLIEAAGQQMASSAGKKRFLEKQLSMDPYLMGISLLRRTAQGDWKPELELSRKDTAPRRPSLEPLADLPDLKEIQHGAVNWRVIQTGSEQWIFRIGLPFGTREGNEGFTRALILDAYPKSFEKMIQLEDSPLVYVLNQSGTLLFQSKPHFSPWETLAHLPIFQFSKATPAPFGSLYFKEAPEASEQFGSFYRPEPSGLVVIHQVPQSVVEAFLSKYLKVSLFTLVMLALLGAAVLSFAIRTHVSQRLARLQRLVCDFLESGQTSVKSHVEALDIEPNDEIGVLSNQIQSLCLKLKNEGQADSGGGEDPRRIDPGTLNEFIDEELAKTATQADQAYLKAMALELEENRKKDAEKIL